MRRPIGVDLIDRVVFLIEQILGIQKIYGVAVNTGIDLSGRGKVSSRNTPDHIIRPVNIVSCRIECDGIPVLRQFRGFGAIEIGTLAGAFAVKQQNAVFHGSKVVIELIGRNGGIKPLVLFQVGRQLAAFCAAKSDVFSVCIRCIEKNILSIRTEHDIRYITIAIAVNDRAQRNLFILIIEGDQRIAVVGVNYDIIRRCINGSAFAMHSIQYESCTCDQDQKEWYRK